MNKTNAALAIQYPDNDETEAGFEASIVCAPG